MELRLQSVWLPLLFSGALFAAGCGRSQTTYADNAAAKPEAQDSEPIRFVKNPDLAPGFELKDLEGQPVSLEEAKGKIVLLNFWATWCGPCRAEIADLVDLQKRYADKLEIIALATDEDDADDVRRFVTNAGINYRVAMVTEPVRLAYGGIAALPTSFIIDPQGRAVQ